MTQSIPQTLPELRIKIGSVAHVQEAVRGMLLDEIMSEIAALSQPMGVAAIPEGVTAAPQEGVSVPPGWKLVPIEMDDQIRNVLIDRCDKISQGRVLLFIDIWHDILAAAPQPPASALPLAVGVEEPTCETCGGRGQITQRQRVGESDFEEWDIDCPVCDGAGHAPQHVQAHIGFLNDRMNALKRECHDWWSAAQAKVATPPPLSTPATGNVGAQLLTDAEAKSLQELAEAVWADLQKNELGGYSGINRPFWLAWKFKAVIERYGYRDVGLKHSKDALDEAYERGRKASASPPPAPPRVPLTDNFKGDNAALCRSIEALLALDAAKALVPHGVGGHARGLLSAAMVRLSGAAK